MLVFVAVQAPPLQALTGRPAALFLAMELVCLWGGVTAALTGLLRNARIASAPVPVQAVLSGLLGAIIAAPFSSGLDVVLGMSDVLAIPDHLAWDRIATFAAETVHEVQVLALPSLALAPILIAVRQSGLRRAAGPSTQARLDQPLSQTGSADGLLSRLGKGRAQVINMVEAQQHYVLVHTDTGSEMVHYRFGDALAELASQDGLQVHRSFWIARHAIAAVRRDGRRWYVETLDNRRIPVSRPHVESVKKLDLPLS
ncbi:hypothetical protein AWH62_07400 [Maricaulis sp. W15]|uniref:LytTR family DNA-binding domain-containing protein n=1 Tax=Maricaulis sp. W15 TaxID=1772333 RepID=UPI000948A5FD|nr:LytTR family DNA-binding domain-containing protein [Maricaulis sp. W15]OLF73967.1 hypothetical protein AWH62_07400 [Maricaulis sp. W15]